MDSKTMNQLTNKAETASTMLVQRYAAQSNMRMVAQKFAKKFSQKIYENLPNDNLAAKEFSLGMLSPQGLDIMEKLVQNEVKKVFN